MGSLLTDSQPNSKLVAVRQTTMKDTMANVTSITYDLYPKEACFYDNFNYLDDDSIDRGIRCTQNEVIVDIPAKTVKTVTFILESNHDKEQNTATTELEDSSTKPVEIQIEPKPKLGNKLKTVLMILNCFMSSIAMGFMYSLGVLFVEIVDDFKSSRAEASPIIALFNLVIFGFGSILGPLMNIYNGGYIYVIGGVVAFVGCIISYFATSVPILIFSLGCITGAGLSVAFFLPYIMVSEIFTKHRLLMLAIASLAPGIGACVFPFLTGVLVETFGWRGVIFIYSALTLNAIPIGFLNAHVKKRLMIEHGQGNALHLKELFSISLFRKPTFIVAAICVLITNGCLSTLIQLFVDIIREKGFSIETASAMLSLSGIADLCGRVVNVLLKPALQKYSNSVQWSVYGMAASMTVLLFAVFNQYEYILVSSILFGFLWGTFNNNYPAMVLEATGPVDYATGLGYCNLIGGAGSLICGPAAGYVYDVTGSYTVVLYCIFGVTTITTLLLESFLFFKHYTVKKHHPCKKQLEKYASGGA